MSMSNSMSVGSGSNEMIKTLRPPRFASKPQPQKFLRKPLNSRNNKTCEQTNKQTNVETSILTNRQVNKESAIAEMHECKY